MIGVSGGIKLVEGLPAGASVEGLRIVWYDDDKNIEPDITFNGIGVEFEVPNVIRFKGAVAYQEKNESGGVEHRFTGDIKLDLISLNMELDCQLVIGRINGDAYLGIYLGVELPAGIPLWSTRSGPVWCCPRPFYPTDGAPERYRRYLVWRG